MNRSKKDSEKTITKKAKKKTEPKIRKETC